MEQMLFANQFEFVHVMSHSQQHSRIAAVHIYTLSSSEQSSQKRFQNPMSYTASASRTYLTNQYWSWERNRLCVISSTLSGFFTKQPNKPLNQSIKQGHSICQTASIMRTIITLGGRNARPPAGQPRGLPSVKQSSDKLTNYESLQSKCFTDIRIRHHNKISRGNPFSALHCNIWKKAMGLRDCILLHCFPAAQWVWWWIHALCRAD